MINPYDLQGRLCNLPGVAGFEGPVREAIAGIVEPFVNKMRVDISGNLNALRRGTFGFKLMLMRTWAKSGLWCSTLTSRAS